MDPRVFTFNRIVAGLSGKFASGMGPKFVKTAAQNFISAGKSSLNHRSNLLRKVLGSDSLLREVAKGLGIQVTFEAVFSTVDDILAHTTAHMIATDGDFVDSLVEVMGSYSEQGRLDELFNSVLGDLTDISNIDMALFTSVVVGALMNRRTRFVNGGKVGGVPDTFTVANMKVMNASTPDKTRILIDGTVHTVKTIAQNPLTYVYAAYASSGVVAGLTGSDGTKVDKLEDALLKGSDNVPGLRKTLDGALSGPRKIKNISKNIAINLQRVKSDSSSIDQELRRIRARLDSDGIVEITQHDR